MASKVLLSSIGGAITLSLCAFGAAAAPGNFGSIERSAHQGGGLVALAHHSGSGMGHSIGHTMMGPRFSGPRIGREAFFTSGNMHFHHHHHRHNRFFFAGVPFYDNYYYDDDACWWSRRYHHWVCPNY